MAPTKIALAETRALPRASHSLRTLCLRPPSPRQDTIAPSPPSKSRLQQLAPRNGTQRRVQSYLFLVKVCRCLAHYA
ncbi:hypothetical protein PsYK624_063360 [Phanerochaete sordida]|uniref:Uncharacterized protein n=1 Tax=Phanerochaete sordida TaxID=48140 RepID=A0A9P3GA52_9APHY|nr:hypothetical protein PsYK624_063360 [Phanerochaete sordida]